MGIQHRDLFHTPSLLRTPWVDCLLSPARDHRAARSDAGRALAAAHHDVPGSPFRIREHRNTDALWAGGDDYGALLFPDGTALLGSRGATLDLHAAPQPFVWREEGTTTTPQAWMAGPSGVMRTQRLEEAGMRASNASLWRCPAGHEEPWEALASGQVAVPPWGSVAAARSLQDRSTLDAMLWITLEASQQPYTALYGSCVHQGRLSPPSLFCKDGESPAYQRAADLLSQALAQAFGPQWMWRLLDQNWGGAPAFIAFAHAPKTAHERVDTLNRHHALWTALRA